MKLLFLYLSLSGAAVCHAFRPLTTRQTHLKLFEAPPSVNAAPPENEGKDAREEIKDYARNLSFVVSDPNGKKVRRFLDSLLSFTQLSKRSRSL